MSHEQTAESFWNRIDVRSLDECWPWLGSTNNTGYGTASWHGRLHTAHRIAAWLLGLIHQPEAPTDRTGDGFILHQCDNRICCNPTHWKVGTYTENIIESYKRGRRTQPKGEYHVNAKLSNEQAEEIRAAYKDGIYQKELASKYNISKACISLIVREKTYNVGNFGF